MPTGRDFLPVYGPSCRIVGRCCVHAAVERQESLKSFVAEIIDANWLGVEANLYSKFECAYAIKRVIVTLWSAFANGWAW